MKSIFLRKVKDFLRVNLWVQQIRLQSYGSWYYFDLFYQIFSKVGDFVTTVAYGLVINEAIRYVSTTDKSLTKIVYIVLGILIYNCTQQIIEYYINNNGFWKGMYQVRKQYQMNVLKKLGSLNWEHIETPSMEKNVQMSFTYSMASVESLAAIHIDLLTIIFTVISAILIAKVSPLLILLIVIKELPGIFVKISKSRVDYALTNKLAPLQVTLQGVMSYFRDFKSLLEIKVSNVVSQLMSFFVKSFDITVKEKLAVTKKYQFASLSTKLFEQAFDIGVYSYYLRQVLFFGMQIGTFQYTTRAIIDINDYIYRVMSKMTSMVDSYRYVRYAYDLVHQENANPSGTKVFKGEKIEIEFDDVSFKYPGNETFALQNVSLKIKDNKTVAIVGENGAGKTTFLKLLMLINTPTSGVIRINGVPIQEYSKDSIYKILAIVSQDFARYDVLTVGQNISIYEDSTKFNQERIEEAAKMSTADEFIKKLSKKYDTLLTKKLDGGTELSTGQWQRLAIARQFYANKPLVILDEPTAAIDPIAEATIFKNLYEHVKDKTVIVVSHRYNTVRAAKKILVFKEGQIIEQGNHEELLELDGYYANAFKVQQEVKAL